MGDIAELYDWCDEEYPVMATCKRCGKDGLQWDKGSGRWVLINESGRPHRCDQRRVHRIVADGFEVLE